jgi:hypothetical protein
MATQFITKASASPAQDRTTSQTSVACVAGICSMADLTDPQIQEGGPPANLTD